VSLWDWAVRAYGGDGVAEACLCLQDEDGQNVPLLLWAVWLADQGIELGESPAGKAAALARNWSDDLIGPLRLLRRRLKTELTVADEAVRLPLREKIKAIELEAEQALMIKLAALKGAGKADINYNLSGLAMSNLRVVSRKWGGNIPETGLARLIEALSDGRFLQYNP
jgi:uncharacterized protein (TIGR02444 family)